MFYFYYTYNRKKEKRKKRQGHVIEGKYERRKEGSG